MKKSKIKKITIDINFHWLFVSVNCFIYKDKDMTYDILVYSLATCLTEIKLQQTTTIDPQPSLVVFEKKKKN